MFAAIFHALFSRFRPAKLLVGLGNPGEEYARTRHNAGFIALDALAGKLGLAFDREACGAELAFGELATESGKIPVALAKPRTFMNASGTAVAGLCAEWNLAPSDVLVVVDDFELPLGSLRLRPSGSPGGHNGLKSISACLGTDEYPRLRLGIGSEKQKAAGKVIDFVLGEFSPDELEGLKLAVDVFPELARDWAEKGTEYCQNRYNRRAETPPNGKREEST